jgi:hypothetical protein
MLPFKVCSAAVLPGETHLVSSPNMSYIPPINIANTRVRLRRDGHFGPDDPFFMPQVQRETAKGRDTALYLAAVQVSPPQDSSLQDRILWHELTDPDFEAIATHPLCHGLLSKRVLECLQAKIKSLTNTLSDPIRDFADQRLRDDGVVLRCELYLSHCVALLHQPASKRETVTVFRLTQRACLDLQARVDWLMEYRPRFARATPASEACPVANVIGAITDDTPMAHRFYIAGMPVWLILPYSRRSIIPNTAFVNMIHPTATEISLPGRVLNIQDSTPAHRIVWEGSVTDHERYIEMNEYLRTLTSVWSSGHAANHASLSAPIPSNVGPARSESKKSSGSS